MNILTINTVEVLSAIHRAYAMVATGRAPDPELEGRADEALSALQLYLRQARPEVKPSHHRSITVFMDLMHRLERPRHLRATPVQQPLAEPALA